jgi:3-oxosteroid 1-dehydrogenase
MEYVWHESIDVLVMGSGASGLTAGLAARKAGADVAVWERTDKLGGTSAMSGGIAWIPNNHHMAEVGSSDTRENALAYLRSLALGASDDALLQTFVDVAPEALKFLESASSLRFRALRMPDYHEEFPGGTYGRSVIAEIVSGKELGNWRSRLRPAPNFPIPITPLDLELMGAVASFTGEGDDDNFLASDEMVKRIENDMLGCGAGLVAGLIKASLDAGIRFCTNARVRRLVLSDGAVTGAVAERDGKNVRIRVRRGVIIASGGFERNDQLVRDFLRGPLQGPIGSPGCEGDGLLLAMEAGAALTNMSEAWWVPVLRIPGEEYEGREFSRPTTIERGMPGVIMVNRKGQRFVNEASNYNDVTRVFHTFDPVAFEFSNLPAWIIMHKGRLDRHAFLTRLPNDPVPNWLIEASTIRELATKLGIDPDSLEKTVARFNQNAALGIDPDFGRGTSKFDVYHGDPSREGTFGTLGPLNEPPYYAMPIYPGSIGTKGGPKTGSNAEVLNIRGNVISGLYAAGNAMGSFMGMAYPGAGGTIGPGITFGYLAGRAAAGRNS